MPKIRATVAYDGTDFHGFARQPGLRTVQGTLERMLSGLTGEPVEVFGSGRTDAGVHARAQVVHWVQSVGPPAERYPMIGRKVLPSDLVIVQAEEVDDQFHARFSTTRKVYRYTVQQAAIEDVFTNRYAWHVSQALNTEEMERAAKHLVGEHDFTSFCAAATPVENKVRTIYAIELVKRDTYLDIICTGSGFLQNMVRILAGTLVDVGLGNLGPDAMPQILDERDRRLAGRTAPARGLCLWHVEYGHVTKS